MKRIYAILDQHKDVLAELDKQLINKLDNLGQELTLEQLLLLFIIKQNYESDMAGVEEVIPVDMNWVTAYLNITERSFYRNIIRRKLLIKIPSKGKRAFYNKAEVEALKLRWNETGMDYKDMEPLNP